jgi:hypothetical protein
MFKYDFVRKIAPGGLEFIALSSRRSSRYIRRQPRAAAGKAAALQAHYDSRP